MKIYIVRHGETEANLSGQMQGGGMDAPLNEKGVRLAELTGKALQGVRFDAAFSSPLTRACQTAELLLRQSGNDCPVMTDPRLLEIMAGEYEGFSFRKMTLGPTLLFFKRYYEDPLHCPAFPSGENVQDVMARSQAFLQELAQKPYETVLVSTHGCTLRCMLNFLYDDPTDFWHGQPPQNCAVSVVEGEKGSLHLVEEDKIYYDPSECADPFGILKRNRKNRT